MIFTYREIPIYYEVHGAGRPLLTIHGWSPDHRLMKGCLEPVFETLETRWQRIYFDLPGMGQTPGAPWIDGSDAMLEVVLAFIDAVLPGQPFSLAGESYGGYLTRGVIKKRPEIVDGMLLICPAVYQDPHPKQLPPFQVIEKDEAFVNSLSEEDRQYFTGINVVQTKRVWEKFNSDVVPGLKLADYAFLEKNLSQHVPYSFEVDQLDAPFMKPSLMVMGRQDNVVGYRDLWDLIENFPRASFAVLDKSGHNMQIEQETIFHALVKDWLERMV